MKPFLLFILAIIPMFGSQLHAQEKILLYPTGAPDSNGITESEQFLRADFLVKVSEPRMMHYPAPDSLATGMAILLCPGGGYTGVSIVKEGDEIAKWFNQLGVSVFVLYYRMPNAHRHIPLKDAHTALKMIHHSASEWNIQTHKIGIMGFSAGGHLAATASNYLACTPYRPAFQILGYPVITMDSTFTHRGSRHNLLGKNAPDEWVRDFSMELQVSPSSPPAFLFHAEDDKSVPIQNSLKYSEALKKMGVPFELHAFKAGGHGFGMRPVNPETDQWPVLLHKWLKQW